MSKRFKNPYIEKLKRTPKDFLYLLLGKYKESCIPKAPPPHFCYPEPESKGSAGEYTVTWINHSTFLIKAGGFTFLTDPIYAEWAGPFPFLGPRRRHPPGILLDDLPPIDFVLLSHNHYDHMCKETIYELVRRFPAICWIVPRNLEKWFAARNIGRVTALNWWETKEFDEFPENEKIRITATPAQHNSGRGIFDVNKTL